MHLVSRGASVVQEHGPTCTVLLYLQLLQGCICHTCRAFTITVNKVRQDLALVQQKWHAKAKLSSIGDDLIRMRVSMIWKKIEEIAHYTTALNKIYNIFDNTPMKLTMVWFSMPLPWHDVFVSQWRKMRHWEPNIWFDFKWLFINSKCTSNVS